ncbi:MAG: ATP-binding cassette domain-containing protein, partial [Rickettsiales bacterium]|nr:ATP-binding cassette domain-containing protein [Rickettsiales bacterium]
ISVKDFLYSGRPVRELEQDIVILYQKIADDSENNKLLTELEEKQALFDSWGGYSAEPELERILYQMNVPAELLNKNLNELSGGQKSKISFIRTLYSQPDILFLDEPTNHLDASSRDWIIDYLQSMRSTVIFISHDEDFVKRLAKKILYLDAMTHKATLYSFGYERFLRTLAETNKSLENQMRNQMREITRIQAFVDGLRGTSGKRKKQADSREKHLEKLKQNIIDVPKTKKTISFDLKPARTGDHTPIIADNVSFQYVPEHSVINKLSFALERDEKFVIIGENGAGKSTLLKLMAKVLNPNSGTITIGKKTDIGYYAQEHDTLDGKASVLENLEKITQLSGSKNRALLGKFNFIGDKVFQSISTLSPGERSRLELAKLCASGANLLLLDEPTNHLDIPTKKSIAHSFRDYGGTLAIVSHDIDFLSELGIGRMLMLPSGKMRFYDENIIRKYMELEKQRGH